MTDPTATPFSGVAGFPDQVNDPAPFDVVYTSVPNGVTATWPAVVGALYYDVYIGRSPQNLFLQQGKTQALTYTFTNLTLGVPYYAQVVAFFETRLSVGSPVQQIFACYIYPPVYSLPSGTYTGCQTFTITSASAGASIYFTTDGTAPTTASTLYTGAQTVCSTTNYRAIAARSVCVSTESDVAYTIVASTSCAYCARVKARTGVTSFWPLGDVENLVGGIQSFSNLTAPTQPMTWLDNGFNIYHKSPLLGVCSEAIYYQSGNLPAAPAFQSVAVPQASLISAIPGGAAPWTIEFVFTGMRRVPSYAQLDQPLVFSEPVGTPQSIALQLQSSGYFTATVNSHTEQREVYDSTYIPYPSGTIKAYLVTLVYDGTLLTIYLNGYRGAGNLTNALPFSGFSGSVNWVADNTPVYTINGLPLYNGLQLCPTNGSDNMGQQFVNANGFQNLSLYNRALSAAEVLAGYNDLVNGTGTTCS